MRFFLISLICLLLTQTLHSSCSVGTIACDNSFSPARPKICDFFSSYVLSEDKSKCELKKVDDCEIPAIPNSSLACFKCLPNHYLDPQTGKCVDVPASDKLENCEYYSLDGSIKCRICEKDFYLDQGQCKAVGEDKIPNCLLYLSQTECRLCQSGTYLKNNRCQVINDVSNCHYHREIECERCQDKYFHDPGANEEMPNIQYIIDNFNFSSYLTENLHYASWHSDFIIQTCSNSKFANCLVQTAYDRCDKCEPQFFVNSQGQCDRRQFPPIENCDVYKSHTECKQCVEKFYLNQNECKAVTEVDFCATYMTDEDKCQACAETHSLNQAENKCILKTSIQSRVQNCPKDDCTNCPEGTQMAMAGNACLPEIPNCSEHQPHDGIRLSLLCKTCAQGYQLNSDNTFCVKEGDSTCYKYSDEDQKCEGCEADHYFKPASQQTPEACQPRSFDGGAGCAFNTSTINTGSCENCQDGYSKVLREVAFKSDASSFYCARVNEMTGDCLQCAENAIGNDTQDGCQSLSINSTGCLQMKAGYFGIDMDNNCALCKNESHYLNGDVCMPRQNTSNCSEYMVDQDECLVCQQSYFPISTDSNAQKHAKCELKPGNFSEIEGCLVYSPNGACETCVDPSNNLLYSPNPTCVPPKYPIPFYFNETLHKKTPPLELGVANCTRYQQVDIGVVKCVECEDFYVGIIPDLKGETQIKFLYDQDSLSMRTYFESCESITRSFKTENKSPSISDQNCRSGMRVPGWAGFMCIGCRPNHQPFGDMLQFDADGVEKTPMMGITSCDQNTDTDMTRKFFGLGSFSNYIYSMIPLGTFINFDSCASETKHLSVSISASRDGDLTFYRGSSSFYTTNKFITCLSEKDFEIPLVPNCQIYQNADNKDHPGGCLVCAPNYFPSEGLPGDMAQECLTYDDCDYSGPSRVLHICETSIHGWETTQNLGTVSVKPVPGAVANCLVYKQLSDQCMLCSKGFSLIGGQCIEVDKLAEHNCSVAGYGISDLTLPSSNATLAIMQTHFFFEIYLGFKDLPLDLCSKCKENYVLNRNMSDISCQSEGLANDNQKISNCVEYLRTSPPMCAKCQFGFVLNKSTGLCVDEASFPNCEELKGTVNVECSRCKSDYLLENNTCLLSNCHVTLKGKCSLCKDGYKHVPPSETRCVLNTDPEDICMAYSPTMQTCGKCKNNQLLYIKIDSRGSKLEWFNCQPDMAMQTPGFLDDLNMTEGYYVHIENPGTFFQGKLHPISLKPIESDELLLKKYKLENASSTSPSSILCMRNRSIEKCQFSYLQSGVNCTKCEEGYKLNALNECIVDENGSGDTECNQTNSCTQCSGNNYLEAGKCRPHTPVDNCAEYASTQDICELCDVRYIPGPNNTCVKTPPQPNDDCIEYDSNFDCVKCAPNFILEAGSKTCVAREAENCKEVEPAEDKCKVCLDGHFMDSQDGQKCKPHSPVNGCAIYRTDRDECEFCGTSKYLSNGECLTVSVEISGCKFYSGASTCSDCNDSLLLKNNQCISGNIDNCASYESENSCLTCKDGYFRESATKCTAYSSSLGCKEFNPNADECLNCPEEHILNDEKKCEKKEPVESCAEYEENSQNCARCVDGFWLDLSTKKCVEREQKDCKEFEPNADICSVCANGKYKDLSDNKCKDLTDVSNCSQYKSNADECVECKKGYFLENNLCWQNPDGIMHCEEYSDLNQCSQCESGFFLTNNQCNPLTNPVEFCQVHSSATKCSTCVDGYYLKTGSECSPNAISNCDVQLSETICRTCASNYVLVRKASSLECEPSGISRCEVAIGGIIKTCAQCEEGYVPNPDRTGCIQSSLVSECAEYETVSSCKHCNSGYVRSEDWSSCVSRQAVTGSSSMTNTNCISEVMKKDPVCSSCKPGYKKGMHGDCLACGGTGCAICGEDSDSCLVCAQGFYMDANMKCNFKEGFETVGKSAPRLISSMILAILLVILNKD